MIILYGVHPVKVILCNLLRPPFLPLPLALRFQIPPTCSFLLKWNYKFYIHKKRTCRITIFLIFLQVYAFALLNFYFWVYDNGPIQSYSLLRYKMWCNESDEIISFSTDFWSLRTTAATPHKPLPYTLITLSLWSNNPQPVTLYTDLIPEVGCLLESGALQSGR